MSSMSSSPIDIARDNTAPICCLLSHVLVRPATSCKLCVITSAIDSISSIWTACKSVAVVVCMTTKHVSMRAVSARPYLGCLRLGSQETSESAKSVDQPHDQSPFYALVRLHAINVSDVFMTSRHACSSALLTFEWRRKRRQSYRR